MSEENRPYTADEIKKKAGKNIDDSINESSQVNSNSKQESETRQYSDMYQPTNTYEAAQPAGPEVPSDIVKLPSNGYFYPSGKNELKVGYMMLQDENVLMSPNLIQDGKALDVLLDRKILERDINRKELLTGDRDEIIMFLRSTGMGDEYTFSVTDPNTEQSFQWTINLSELERNYCETPPDNDGCYSFTLPNSGNIVKYSFLTVGEEEEIQQTDEERQKYYNISSLPTLRLAKQIKEIDGKTNKGDIENMVEWMPLLDARKLKQEINRREPGINRKIEVKTPSGQVMNIMMPITSDFFFPEN